MAEEEGKIFDFGLVNLGFLATTMLILVIMTIATGIPPLVGIIFALAMLAFGVDAVLKWGFTPKSVIISTIQILTGLMIFLFVYNISYKVLIIPIAVIAILLVIYFVVSLALKREIDRNIAFNAIADSLLIVVILSIANFYNFDNKAFAYVFVFGGIALAFLLTAISRGKIKDAVIKMFESLTR